LTRRRASRSADRRVTWASQWPKLVALIFSASGPGIALTVRRDAAPMRQMRAMTRRCPEAAGEALLYVPPGEELKRSCWAVLRNHRHRCRLRRQRCFADDRNGFSFGSAPADETRCRFVGLTKVPRRFPASAPSSSGWYGDLHAPYTARWTRPGTSPAADSRQCHGTCAYACVHMSLVQTQTALVTVARVRRADRRVGAVGRWSHSRRGAFGATIAPPCHD
jgi:hypothetical protein